MKLNAVCAYYVNVSQFFSYHVRASSMMIRWSFRHCLSSRLHYQRSDAVLDQHFARDYLENHGYAEQLIQWQLKRF